MPIAFARAMCCKSAPEFAYMSLRSSALRWPPLWFGSSQFRNSSASTSASTRSSARRITCTVLPERPGVWVELELASSTSYQGRAGSNSCSSVGDEVALVLVLSTLLLCARESSFTSSFFRYAKCSGRRSRSLDRRTPAHHAWRITKLLLLSWSSTRSVRNSLSSSPMRARATSAYDSSC